MANTAPHNIYWGETHDNTYQFSTDQPGVISTALERAASHLDFYAAAYYTAQAAAFEQGGHLAESSRPHKLVLEGWKPRERLDREWAGTQQATRAANQPGAFVTFAGYEWQGNGSGGDHNVFFRHEGGDIHRVDTLPELYERLRGQDAIAIPHHTAYRPGVRGRDWSIHDERITPFAEIYSIHGCSETDEEWVGMRQNSHMGPAIGPGTYQSALDRGCHLGAVCGTDNWGEMPGHYGHGRMACLAAELTREALWEAFRSRRVYGVTGDRILLGFEVNGAGMGSVITLAGPREVCVNVVGSDALDRIEILRNGRVIATHNHQGSWVWPQPGRLARFKMRVEAGWGPRASEMPVMERDWTGEISVDGGRMRGFEPCWISPGQRRPDLDGQKAAFAFHSSTRDAQQRWQNANVFEFEADSAAAMRVQLNGLCETGRVLDFGASSREMWFRGECAAMLRDTAGIEPGSTERNDIFHHVAFKAKLHRLMPESAYTAALRIQDDEPFEGEINYRVRVEQRNGQRAWSSPIWVSGGR